MQKNKQSNHIGLRIRKIRELAGLTRLQFSQLLNCSTASLVEWEYCKRNLNYQAFLKIIKVYPEYTHYLIYDSLDFLDQQIIPGDKSGEKIGEVAKLYLEHHKINFPSSYDTQSRTIVLLVNFFGDRKVLKTITKIDIDKFKESRIKSGISRSTINRNLSVLSAMLTFYKDHIDMDFSGIEIQKMKNISSKPPEFYTQQELQDIYNAAIDTRHIWQLLANTGMRIGEFYSLKSINVSEDSIAVVSNDELRTKSGKYRIIPLNSLAKEALLGFDLSSEYVAKRYSSVEVYQRKFRRICNQIGLSHKAGVHILRHTFASHLVAEDVSLSKVQKLMGHASIRTTEKYLHLHRDSLIEAVNRISP